MTTKAEKKPHDVDLAVGARMHQLRLLRGLTQEQLATEIDVSFQQVQKYERGLNRLSASRLKMVAKALNVEIGELFAEVEGHGTIEISGHEETALVMAYRKMPDDMKGHLFGLITAAAA